MASGVQQYLYHTNLDIAWAELHCNEVMLSPHLYFMDLDAVILSHVANKLCCVNMSGVCVCLFDEDTQLV